MPDTVNLDSQIKKQMPAGMADFLREAGRVAREQQQKIYMVGGIVRDLLLGRSSLDLDLVVEGDAINLAQELARVGKGKLTTHPHFGTAKLQWDDGSVDLATARAETYARPGALPAVKSGTIDDDLSRRDFTINAMAVELNPRHFGELIDPHGGCADLEKGLVRVLHEKSFQDDATRIWRALRYEQRLGFRLEPSTLRWLKRDIAMLATVSGDRIRNELKLVLEEEFPEKVLHRAGELGVLAGLHPSLKGDDWLAETYALAREQSLPDAPSRVLYLTLLAYRLTSDEIEQLISYLRLPKPSAHTLRDTQAVKDKIRELSVNGLAPSLIYSLLHGYSSTALIAGSLATDSQIAAEHIELYLNVLSHVHSSLTGEDVKRLGVAYGPRIREILQKLREARLDGNVASKKDEEEMVRRWLTTG